MTEYMAPKAPKNINAQHAVGKATSGRDEEEDDEFHDEHARRMSAVYAPRAPLKSNATEIPQVTHPMQNASSVQHEQKSSENRGRQPRERANGDGPGRTTAEAGPGPRTRLLHRIHQDNQEGLEYERKYSARGRNGHKQHQTLDGVKKLGRRVRPMTYYWRRIWIN